VNGVCSNPVDLIFFTEPMNEPDKDSIDGQSTDDNSNLTVDFGFISGPTGLEEGEEPGSVFDNFMYLPLAIR
ncbi:MAG: hypothetical protein KDE46_31410, partial [Caldilineaceae bacterium]|nr:hypothetical protein [Caldilineaceae bacterium]